MYVPRSDLEQFVIHSAREKNAQFVVFLGESFSFSV